MLTFAVFDSSGPARLWPLRQAYLFGPGQIPVQADLRFENSLIVCERTSTEAAGLAVQFPVDAPSLDESQSGAPGALGTLMLRTALLPDRPAPYLLSLELARFRIMLLLNKLEQWGHFDLPADHPVMRRLDLARGLFTKSLVAQRATGAAAEAPGGGFSQDADRYARRALALAVDAGEQLALLQADVQLRARYTGELYEKAVRFAMSAFDGDSSGTIPGGNGPLRAPDGAGVVHSTLPSLGCTLSPSHFSEELTRAVSATCDFVSMPMRWMDMEPEEGAYAFAKTDRWIEWAVRTAKLPVHGGPIVDFRATSVPEWLYIWENDYETLRELVYEHVKNVVTRYRRTVSRWTVASGMHVNEDITLTLEQIMDLTRICVLLVRKLQPSAKVQVEIVQPWGEYTARSRRGLPPLLYAEMLGQANIPVDAIALRLQLGQPAPGRAARDLMALSDLLDRYAELNKPLAITAMGVPSQPITSAAPSRRGDTPPDPAELDPGIWHAPWTAALQAEWLSHAVAIALSKPAVTSVCWQEMSDAAAVVDMPFGGLLTETGAAKPAARRMLELRQALRERRSPFAAPAAPAR